ncbi:MAG: CHAD domain-containing protein [Bacteroidales bacterium]|nr:CHAD domain-containing protein [Bacteroidales bacterium]MBN2757505.1 CHAD domain-containing protein [Bacteroidales bacterium]
MASIKLEQYLTLQENIFSKNYDKSITTFDVDAIHDLRVSIKRLNTLYRLLELIDSNNFVYKKNFKELRKIFKLAGIVRDYQIIEYLINQNYSQLKNINILSNFIKGKKEIAIKQFIKSKKKLNLENVKNSILNAKNTIAKSFDNDIDLAQNKLIKENIDLFNKEINNNLHKARKKLKNYLYLIEMQAIDDELKSKVFQNIKLIASYIGNWHDIIIIENEIKKYKSSHNNEINFEDIKNNNKKLKQNYLSEFYKLTKEFL